MDVTAVPAETADAESARWLLELSAQADAEGDIKFAVYLADAAAWHAGEGL